MCFVLCLSFSSSFFFFTSTEFNHHIFMWAHDSGSWRFVFECRYIQNDNTVACEVEMKKFIHHHTCLVMNQSHCLMHPSHSAHIYTNRGNVCRHRLLIIVIDDISDLPQAESAKTNKSAIVKYIGSERERVTTRSEKNPNLCRRNSIRFHQQFYLILISSNSISC